MTSGSLVSTSKVCSWPTDFAGSPSWTGSGSIPRARSTSDAPCLPKRRTTRSGGSAARSPIVRTAYSASAAAVFSPTPHRRPIGSGARNAASSPGRHDHQAIRLAQIRGDLGHQLGAGDADGHRQPDLVADRRPDLARDRRPVPEQGRRPGDVEERLVDRDRLDRRGEPPQDRHDVTAGGLVAPAVDRQEDPVRTAPIRLAQRHRRMHAEDAGLVARRRHDPAGVLAAGATDDDRPATQLGTIALFDRREEGVQVDVQDCAAHGATMIVPPCMHRWTNRGRPQRSRPTAKRWASSPSPDARSSSSVQCSHLALSAPGSCRRSAC